MALGNVSGDAAKLGLFRDHGRQRYSFYENVALLSLGRHHFITLQLVCPSTTLFSSLPHLSLTHFISHPSQSTWTASSTSPPASSRTRVSVEWPLARTWACRVGPIARARPYQFPCLQTRQCSRAWSLVRRDPWSELGGSLSICG